jgi:hypothetical protein
MASTLTMARSVSLTDYQPELRKKADKRTWDHEKISTVGSTKRGQEKYPLWGGLPLPVPSGELKPVPFYDIKDLGETPITIGKYLLGTRFSNELIEDAWHLPNLMSEAGKCIGESFGQMYDKLRSYPFDQAFVNTYQKMWDGAAMCTTHTLTDGTTYSNLLTASPPDYDTLWSALIAFNRTRKNHVGLLTAGKAKWIVCGPALEQYFTKILNNSVEPDTLERNDSFIKKNYGLELIVDPFLTSTTAWFILGEDFKENNIWLWRKKMVVDEPFQDKDFRAVKLAAEMRGGGAVTDYLGILGNAGA